TGRLQVVRPVLVDGAPHRALHGVRRVEADVALVETKRVRDGIHHVADADDAGEGDAVEELAHGEDGNAAAHGIGRDPEAERRTHLWSRTRTRFSPRRTASPRASSRPTTRPWRR